MARLVGVVDASGLGQVARCPEICSLPIAVQKRLSEAGNYSQPGKDPGDSLLILITRSGLRGHENLG